MSRSAADEAYDVICEMIISGALSAGQQIVESAIADTLGISRTPVREAIRRLQQDGLVEVVRNRGCFLRKPSYAELADGYEMIALLSGMACRHLALGHNTLPAEDLQMLNSILDTMEECLNQKQIHGWVEQDIRFHRLLVELSNIPQLNNMYDHLSMCVNQVLWLITPLFVDCALSTRDHREILSLITGGDGEETFLFVRNHHMRTAEIIRKVDSLNGGRPALY